MAVRGRDWTKGVAEMMPARSTSRRRIDNSQAGANLRSPPDGRLELTRQLACKWMTLLGTALTCV